MKNEDYHGGEVNLDELDIIFYDDDQTKLIAYENGDIDLADLNASLLSQYETNYADEITAYHPLGTAFISLNLNDQYLSNVNVRKAISLAINREELVSAVLNGAGIPATSYLNNGIPGHDCLLYTSKKAVAAGREAIAKSIGAKTNELYFTGGGSESDNWALKATAEAYKSKGNHIITSKIEHHAILHTCEWLENHGFEVTYILSLIHILQQCGGTSVRPCMPGIAGDFLSRFHFGNPYQNDTRRCYD